MGVHVKDANHDQVILQTFPDLLCSKTFYDILFLCKNCKVIEAHRLLLGAVSPFLQAIFIEQASRDVIQISLPDCEVSDVHNVIRFAYEGVIRLDQSEMEEFQKIKSLLGLNISYEILDSHSGETVNLNNDTPEDSNTSIRNTGLATNEEDSPSILPTAAKSNNLPADKETRAKDSNNSETDRDPNNLALDMNQSRQQTERVNAKRKHEEEHQASKKSSTEKDMVIQNLNDIIRHLSPPLENQLSVDSHDGNGKQKEPLLVPVKYLPALFGFIEKRKTEKKMEEMIEAYVKKYLLRLKSDRKKKRNDKQIANGFPSPVIRSNSINKKQGPNIDLAP